MQIEEFIAKIKNDVWPRLDHQLEQLRSAEDVVVWREKLYEATRNEKVANEDKVNNPTLDQEESKDAPKLTFV